MTESVGGGGTRGSVGGRSVRVLLGGGEGAHKPVRASGTRGVAGGGRARGSSRCEPISGGGMREFVGGGGTRRMVGGGSVRWLLEHGRCRRRAIRQYLQRGARLWRGVVAATAVATRTASSNRGGGHGDGELGEVKGARHQGGCRPHLGGRGGRRGTEHVLRHPGELKTATTAP